MRMNQSIIDLDAYKKWMLISEEDRNLLLGNGFCVECMISKFGPGYSLSIDDYGNILIDGFCINCGKPMTRLVEKEWYDDSVTDNNFGYDGYEEEGANPEFVECLKIFAEWLSTSNLSEKTKAKHMENVDFYVIDFLNYYEDCKTIAEGCVSIGLFLGDWFIRKCMWSSKTSIKENATSIKKFYKCMLEYDRISKADYKMLCDEIKDGMDDWLGRFERYMDPDYDIEDWLWE